MEHNVLMNLSYIMALSITFIIILMFPGISLELWQLPVRKWSLYKARRLFWKRKRVEAKARKYWEIDLTKMR